MKNLVVCLDGTWNNPKQEDNGIPAPTNVVKLYNAVIGDAAGNGQLKFYHPGVGGEDIGLKAQLLGGMLGDGIERHICSAYHWLGHHYVPGDRIFIYGFSRGAFSARSLAGFLAGGLLDLRSLLDQPDEAWRRVHTAFEQGYRKSAAATVWAQDHWPLHHNGGKTPVHFLGVWDTVGALGIPDDIEIINILDDKEEWEFHDTLLGDHVQHARHAMALDERRSSFTITRWENAATHADARELWFPGVHSDVGGGYANCDLSNIALRWMLEESIAYGLGVRPGVIAALREDAAGVLHESYKGIFAKFRSRPRNFPAVITANSNHFHPSVFARQQSSPIEHPPYHSPVTRLEVGQSATVSVFANQHWNQTNIFLEANHEYTFQATGHWKDSNDSCDWCGTEDSTLTKGDVIRMASSFFGKFEELFKKNASRDFYGTKRVESLPWFCLVGAIANDSGAKATSNDGSPAPHQYEGLFNHAQQPLKVTHSGYLYCFANDAWAFYENNKGSIQLTVTRTG